MKPEIPIFCTLTDAELQVRREAVLRKISVRTLDRIELENGFRYSFPAEDGILQELAELIELERKCCPFLNFTLSIESGRDKFSLELTGADGTKEMLLSLFEYLSPPRLKKYFPPAQIIYFHVLFIRAKSAPRLFNKF